MLSNRDRCGIALRFVLLGPLVGGLMIAVPVAMMHSSKGNLVEGFLGILILSYPAGLIPAAITGYLVQRVIARRMRRSLPLNGAHVVLTGAGAGLLGSYVTAVFFFNSLSLKLDTAREAILALMLLLPGAVAGAVCTFLALRKLRSKADTHATSEHAAPEAASSLDQSKEGNVAGLPRIP